MKSRNRARGLRGPRRGSVLSVAAALLVLAALALPASPARAAEGPSGAVPFELQLIPVEGSARMTTAWDREGILYLRGEDIAFLVGGVQYWRSELGRWTLAAGKHEVAVIAGSDIAMVDGARAIHLAGPAFLWRGRMMVPLDLFVDEEGVARPWVTLPVAFSREQRRLIASLHEGTVTGAVIELDRVGWKLVLDADGPVRHEVIRNERASFVVSLAGISYDPLLFPLPTAHAWFQGLEFHQLRGNLEISFSPGAGAVGYRVSEPQPDRVVIFLGFDERDLREGTIRRFSTPVSSGPIEVRTVALDPGHGGSDPGAALEKTTESRLAYRICLRVAELLRESFDFETLITRDPAEGPDPGARGAFARQVESDVLVSVHVHARPGGPSAFVADVSQPRSAPPAELAGLGFRGYASAQVPHIASSRLLARTLVDAVAGRLGETPRGVSAADLPLLQGASMPAATLELGLGGGDGHPPRVWDDETVDEIAEGIVEGIRLFALAGEERR